MPKITVTIDKKGNATIHAEGFSGPACTRATANLVAALGGAREEEPTAEFYEPDLQTEQEVRRG